ncbi:hypothetical protein [Naasia sp. SYSU D00057]|uniref:hypothetical protein n=1 Tax=Naasia sp. SYSU D00057 TaxID=2817380 RepID=UPI001B315B96|nr:hypothetical protein [Naasia sp. SYSU D00057]
MDAGLQELADELYGLTPSDFTAQRNARAKEVRAAGDRDLAALVAKLPKPSVAAWGANLLVRERADQIGDVLSLGALLREAQEDLDPEALRTLTRQRRQLVAALGREAARLASGRGQQLSSAAVEELEQTLQAAMTDPAAADALRTGRLVRSLTGTGVEAVDLTDAVAAPDGGPAPTRKAEPAPEPAPAPRGAARGKLRAVPRPEEDEERAERERERQRKEQERAERERAEQALAEARRSAEEADREAGRADRRLRDVERRREEARDERERVRAEVRRLKAELAELEGRLGGVEDELESLETDRDEAARAADRARLSADRAQEAVARAEERLR